MVPARQTSKRFSLFLPGDIGFDVPELVFGGLKSGCMRADEDAGVQLVCWLFMTDGVLVKDHVVMVAANDDGGFFLFVTGTVVQYDVSLEAVAMCAGFIAFFSKLDAVFGVGDDSVAGECVVRAAATNGDAHAGVFE